MSKENTMPVLNKISDLFGVTVDWKSEDACSVYVDDKYNVMIVYDGDLDRIIFYAVIDNIRNLEESKIKEYLKSCMEKNLFGISAFGGTMGLSDAEDIVLSLVFRNASSLNIDDFDSNFVDSLLSIIEKEIDSFRDF
ncbi:MAG: type III secretion system chaperone [Chlamydiia bacterium]|nr:type III secretion system chaperone [Chlamydiia bacterium]